jgi:hypothetical protein
MKMLYPIVIWHVEFVANQQLSSKTTFQEYPTRHNAKEFIVGKTVVKLYCLGE